MLLALIPGQGHRLTENTIQITSSGKQSILPSLHLCASVVNRSISRPPSASIAQSEHSSRALLSSHRAVAMQHSARRAQGTSPRAYWETYAATRATREYQRDR